MTFLLMVFKTPWPVGALVELGYESMDSGVVKGLSWLRLGTFYPMSVGVRLATYYEKITILLSKHSIAIDKQLRLG